jgi:hypothetical protein
VTHYLRTFEHLAPQEKVAPPHRRRRRTWLALPILALLGLTWALRSGDQAEPPVEATKRAHTPRIAMAPSQPQQQPQPSEAVPPVRVVERSGPKLIEKMLAEKFGTELPKRPAAPPRGPEPAQVAIAKPAAPPPPAPIMDRPDPSERPRVAEPPTVVAARPATPPTPPQIADRPALSEMPRVAERPKAEKTETIEKAKKPEMIARAPARLTAPLTTSRDDEEMPETTPKPGAQTAEPVDEAEAAVPPQEPKPARVEEWPVVAQQAERTRPVEAERVAAADTAVTEKPVVTERPVAVIERVVATPAVAVASAPRGDVAPVAAERVAVAVRTTGTRSSGPTDDAVRSLLDRYAAAWRGHDVDTLRAIGQVTNDGQAAALRQYFADVGDLEVEVRVLDIRTDGDRATVRFTRRDTFKDPTGRSIAKESPPIEKVVVTTPQGLRFGPAS